MRGVPRARRAISAAPDGSTVTPRMPAARTTMLSRSTGGVVVEPGDQAEAVAQRAGDEAGAGGGADEGEPGQVEPDGSGRRALAQHDVELEVLHGRVEDLLDGPREAVDLVDEQHVALVEAGEDGSQVAGALERGARGDLQADLHLGGDDAGQGGLAQAGRPGEQQVVGGLAAPAGGLEDDPEVLLELGLADELVERVGPQPALVVEARAGVGRLGDLDAPGQVLGDRVGAEQLVAHLGLPQPTASRCRAVFSSSDTLPSSGRSRTTAATSSGW